MNKIKVSGNLWKYSVSAFNFNRVFLLVILKCVGLFSQVNDLPSPHLFGCKTLPKSWIWPAFYSWIGFIVLLPGLVRPCSIWFRISVLHCRDIFLSSFFFLLSFSFLRAHAVYKKQKWSSNLQYKKSFYCVVEWIPEKVVYWVLRRDSGDFLRIHRPVQAKMHWGRASSP